MLKTCVPEVQDRIKGGKCGSAMRQTTCQGPNELEAAPSPRLVVTDGTIFKNPFPEILYGKFYIPQTTHTDSNRSLL